MTEGAAGYATANALAYAPLLCCPSSAGWKELGNCVIRDILRDMLSEAGFGRGKEAWKLGVGLPPVGWPAGIEWSNFKWSTTSGLKNAAVTDIIISMLQAAGINSETHMVSLKRRILRTMCSLLKLVLGWILIMKKILMNILLDLLLCC